MYVLTPNDWKNMMKMILTITQYMVWFSDYCDACMAQAGALQQQEPPVLVIQLTGDSAYSNSRTQMNYPFDIYDLIAKITMRAI